jgi:glucose/mannose-6-phosphate isomerase
MATSPHKPLTSYRERVDDFPNQFARGIEAAERVAIPQGPFERVIFCGMGGSALGAEFVNIFLDLRPDGVIHRDFGLPNDATHKSLVIATSFSGETRETLSAAREAAEKEFSLIVVSAGGQLTKFAEEKKLPLVQLAPGGPARLSVGQQIAALLQVLFKAGAVEDHSEALIAAAAEIAQRVEIKALAKMISSELKGKFPLLYSGRRLSASTHHWKIMINETAKVPAFSAVLPESGHNEIEAFGQMKKEFQLVTLREEKESPRLEKNIVAVEKIARETGMGVTSVRAKGQEYLEQLLYLHWLGDWVALEMAEGRGVDPMATPLIDGLKK